MKNVIKVLFFLGVFALFMFILFEIKDRYYSPNESKKQIYSRTKGTMLISGMSSDKSKVDELANSFEKDEMLNKYWEHLHKASFYREKDEWNKATEEVKKALPYAKRRNEYFMVYMQLARSYEKVGKYELAIEAYENTKKVNSREDVTAETNKKIEMLKAKLAEQ
jgi:tetratricopeptide (TPR) repeat protein